MCDSVSLSHSLVSDFCGTLSCVCMCVCLCVSVCVCLSMCLCRSVLSSLFLSMYVYVWLTLCPSERVLEIVCVSVFV